MKDPALDLAISLEAHLSKPSHEGLGIQHLKAGKAYAFNLKQSSSKSNFTPHPNSGQ